jgi:hypothetical protein
MSDNYECDQSPTGEHLHGTYYCSLSGTTEFVYSDEKDKYKGKQNFCAFNFCPFCGEGLTDKVNHELNKLG